jgi:hypothetical protein
MLPAGGDARCEREAGRASANPPARAPRRRSQALLATAHALDSVRVAGLRNLRFSAGDEAASRRLAQQRRRRRAGQQQREHEERAAPHGGEAASGGNTSAAQRRNMRHVDVQG